MKNAKQPNSCRRNYLFRGGRKSFYSRVFQSLILLSVLVNTGFSQADHPFLRCVAGSVPIFLFNADKTVTGDYRATKGVEFVEVKVVGANIYPNDLRGYGSGIKIEIETRESRYNSLYEQTKVTSYIAISDFNDLPYYDPRLTPLQSTEGVTAFMNLTSEALLVEMGDGSSAATTWSYFYLIQPNAGVGISRYTSVFKRTKGGRLISFGSGSGSFTFRSPTPVPAPPVITIDIF